MITLEKRLTISREPSVAQVLPVASYADALWARHAILRDEPKGRLLRRIKLCLSLSFFWVLFFKTPGPGCLFKARLR